MTTLQLQRKLLLIAKRHQRFDFDPGPLDGVYGPKTKTALENFKYAIGLPANSVIDSQTQKALDEALQAEKGQIILQLPRIISPLSLPLSSYGHTNWTVIGIAFAIAVSLLTVVIDNR